MTVHSRLLEALATPVVFTFGIVLAIQKAVDICIEIGKKFYHGLKRCGPGPQSVGG